MRAGDIDDRQVAVAATTAECKWITVFGEETVQQTNCGLALHCAAVKDAQGWCQRCSGLVSKMLKASVGIYPVMHDYISLRRQALDGFSLKRQAVSLNSRTSTVEPQQLNLNSRTSTAVEPLQLNLNSCLALANDEHRGPR